MILYVIYEVCKYRIMKYQGIYEYMSETLRPFSVQTNCKLCDEHLSPVLRLTVASIFFPHGGIGKCGCLKWQSEKYWWLKEHSAKISTVLSDKPKRVRPFQLLHINIYRDSMDPALLSSFYETFLWDILPKNIMCLWGSTCSMHSFYPEKTAMRWK